MKVVIANMSAYNWEICKENAIFGLRRGVRRFSFERGDIFLMRVTGRDNGVKGIWAFESATPVTDQTKVPWTDAEYDLIMYFSPLILEFKKEFSEEFSGASRYSEKVKLNASRIIGSVVRLTNTEASGYLKALLSEKKDELNVKSKYLGIDITVSDFIQDLISKLAKRRKEIEDTHPQQLPIDKFKIEDLVGDPINFRGIVYAPMNEAGVILLFSKIMSDLGIFYESSPSGFPDMIGRRRTDRGLEKIFIEFEYKSKNFVAHGHDPKKCDLIVCWEHNWPDCPIEVIALKEAIDQLRD